MLTFAVFALGKNSLCNALGAVLGALIPNLCRINRASKFSGTYRHIDHDWRLESDGMIAEITLRFNFDVPCSKIMGSSIGLSNLMLESDNK